MSPQVVRVIHLLVETHELEVAQPTTTDGDWVDVLASTLLSGQVAIGDVVLVGADVPVKPEHAGSVLTSADTVLHRTEHIWDVYSSTFGARLLGACNPGVAPHHTQIRWFGISGFPVAQVAIYPQPALASGVRMWCDPALVVLFVEESGLDALAEQLSDLQPLWERLRAHHGPPLIGRPHPRLKKKYPVPNRVVPLTRHEWLALEEAVAFLKAESVIDEVISSTASPQRAVEHMLVARRQLLRHRARLLTILEHSHGSIRAKYQAIRDLADQKFPPESGEAARHLSAPHEHLMLGFNETRVDVESLATGVSDTASLVASATVGRLLDRSEANRTAGTAVGAALAVIAFVSIFAAVAAIPSGRPFESYLKLSGWLGFGAAIVTLLVIGLARLADRPAEKLSGKTQQRLRVLLVATIVATPLMFLLGALLPSAILVGSGVVLAAMCIASYAASNDFR